MPRQTFFNLPEDKRNPIIDLALDEFSKYDYKNASISRIVARAGIAKGSLYQYFEDNRDLFLYLVEISGQAKTFTPTCAGCSPPGYASASRIPGSARLATACSILKTRSVPRTSKTSARPLSYSIKT